MLAFVTFLSLLLAVAPVQARKGLLEYDGHARSVEVSMCDTQQPDDTLRSIHSELSAQKKLRKVKPRAPQSFAIDTYFHFVVTTDTAYQYPPERRNQLAAAQLWFLQFFSLSFRPNPQHTTNPPFPQLKALSTAYAPLTITFNTPSPPTYTVNTTWATNSDDLAMKTALRIGTYSSLNIYFQSNLSSPGTAYDPSSSFLLGYCELPTSATHTSCLSSPSSSSSSGCTSTSTPPTTYVKDGCNVLLASMPGGGMQEYDQGKTAVHEVGHWFGLLHTFQDNSCASGDQGDYVDDTPQEMTATDGCPVGKDSCPGSAGMDPIGNYMDYSSDAWLLYRFLAITAGADNRLV
ncbi:MAG: hypothetical protein Q9225_003897 [Loekoesia sp. 1 TL-2023]